MAFLKTILAVISFCVLMAPGFGYESALNIIKNCPSKQESIFLTAKQVLKIQKLGEPYFNSALQQRTTYSCKSEKIYAYIQTDIVRTLPQTIITYISKKGGVLDLEVKSFSEPLEYKAPIKWLAQFINKIFTKKLKIGHQIDGLTGATLTSTSTSRLVRRSLLIHRVLAN
ncbi:MAG: hypothetical protein HN509_18085 [Halobacteriovoraceae bacterium]|jgi:hypothetical protein|nr:hypothetical protein [Halobacteriovoraceae bacterium]MBT5093424.1 hypothetical protein [Halobacteriovoraceae bacterium]